MIVRRTRLIYNFPLLLGAIHPASQIMPLTLHIAAQTDPGLVYKTNEDAIFATANTSSDGKPMGLLIVADGVGGHKAGEVASRMVIDVVRAVYNDLTKRVDKGETPSEEELKSVLRAAIQTANQVLYAYAQQNAGDAGNLGSTVACGLIFGDLAVIANVGDSRTYLLTSGKVSQISQDHSFVAELVRHGIVSPEDLYNHPQRSVITRALGQQGEVDVDVWAHTLQAGDRLLVCSDGLWELVADESKIAETLGRKAELPDIAKDLIAAANEKGGGDNISAIVAELTAE